MRDNSNDYRERLKAAIIQLGADLAGVADIEPLKKTKGSSGQETQ
jgi:hypothetical protein